MPTGKCTRFSRQDTGFLIDFKGFQDAKGLLSAFAAHVLLNDQEIGHIGQPIKIEVVPTRLAAGQRLHGLIIRQVLTVDETVAITIAGARRLGGEGGGEPHRQGIVMALLLRGIGWGSSPLVGHTRPGPDPSFGREGTILISRPGGR